MTYEIDESCTGCGMCLSICPVGAVSGGPGKQHSVNGDLCIGCGACARVCADSCVSDSSGNRPAREVKSKWLIPHFDAAKCRRCGKCYEMCPAGIITRPSEDRMPILTNAKLCASCRWCEKVCVFDAIKFAPASSGDGNTER